MDTIEPNWPGLVVFGFAWLLACVGLFFVTGSLPIRLAPAGVRGGTGPLLVWANLICALLLAALAFGVALAGLRLTSPIVFGGLIFLFAPFAVQHLPISIKDTKLGHHLLLAIQLAAIALLFASGALNPVLVVVGF